MSFVEGSVSEVGPLRPSTYEIGRDATDTDMYPDGGSGSQSGLCKSCVLCFWLVVVVDFCYVLSICC